MLSHGFKGAREGARKLVGVIQLCSGSDPLENYSKISNYVKELKKEGASFICLPENFAFMAETPEEGLKFSQPLECSLIQDYKNLAKEEGVWLSLGGFQEKIDEKKKYNSNILVNDKGEIVSVYRKTHLFDFKFSVTAPSLSEREHTQQGSKIEDPVDTPLGKMGLTICYDVRFPEIYRTLFYKGAEVILVPSAFLVKTGYAHWESLLRARAIENQCYIIAAAQVGQHNSKRISYGHSCVIDPWGEVISQASDKECAFITEIDLEYLAKVRQNMPCIEHVRKDLY